jgi:leucyl aminopeptidase
VWDERRISREKLGGLLAVNQGSTNPARLVRLQYTPTRRTERRVALVGKGITFDSGGLSLKTGAGMMTMKVDMSGGAAVLAAMSALGAVGARVAVDGWIPLTDNMTGGDAQRPGDVFRARNGKTVEVLNTDAEGRLVLADALALAAETEPDAIIDIATLTGAASVALGSSYAALMATDDALADRLAAAGERTDESIWRLPLPDEYRSQLDSPVADLKNIGSGAYGGALVAGLFLKEFAGDGPWGHIDVGMAAFSDADKGIITKGATGYGVRLLVDALANWE